ncbi:hypothetical protein [Myxococcus xanthus]
MCERGELAHVRGTNAIRVLPADVDAFIARRRASRARNRSETLASADF